MPPFKTDESVTVFQVDLGALGGMGVRCLRAAEQDDRGQRRHPDPHHQGCAPVLARQLRGFQGLWHPGVR
eukprot:14894887-Alexandrium_andersonii.AAC.1